MKRILAIALTLSALCRISAEGLPSLLVHMNDGLTTRIALSEYPIVKIDGELMTIKGSATDLELQLEKVNKFTYVDTEESIHDVILCEDFELSDDAITVIASDCDKKLCITAINGRVEYACKVKVGNVVKIPLNRFAPGVYVITINGVSSKLILK